jgi:hypothetical protein
MENTIVTHNVNALSALIAGAAMGIGLSIFAPERRPMVVLYEKPSSSAKRGKAKPKTAGRKKKTNSRARA